MIKHNIVFSDKARISKKNKRLIQNVFEFYCKELHLIQPVTCKIVSSDGLSKTTYGCCYDETNISIRNVRDIKTVLLTIIHELRHCFQWQSGRMGWDETMEQRIWLGRMVKDEEIHEPWEDDAMMFEHEQDTIINFFIKRNRK